MSKTHFVLEDGLDLFGRERADARLDLFVEDFFDEEWERAGVRVSSGEGWFWWDSDVLNTSLAEAGWLFDDQPLPFLKDLSDELKELRQPTRVRVYSEEDALLIGDIICRELEFSIAFSEETKREAADFVADAKQCVRRVLAAYGFHGPTGTPIVVAA